MYFIDYGKEYSDRQRVRTDIGVSKYKVGQMNCQWNCVIYDNNNNIQVYLCAINLGCAAIHRCFDVFTWTKPCQLSQTGGCKLVLQLLIDGDGY